MFVHLDVCDECGEEYDAVEENGLCPSCASNVCDECGLNQAGSDGLCSDCEDDDVFDL